MASSLSVNASDFNELKSNFAAWLKTQPQFADFELDRPGDNMNALLGLLAYNTYINLFYHNMSVTESFLDTAQFRDSAVSRAKELNYLPRSFSSASAVVDIAVTSSNLSRSSIILTKGTQFIARIGDRSYTFTTDRSYVSTTSVVNGSTITFTIPDVELFEGHYLTETIPYQADVPYVIPNEQVDISSINIVVMEDNGGTNLTYTRATTLFDIDEESKVYFIQGSPGSKYEIVFGDGTFGRKPKANSLIAIDYRISNGELPNGARDIKAGEAIDGETSIQVTVTTPANSGAVFESLESIRFNAPRHFESQGNAVNANDYKSLLIEAFPEIIDVNAYGGEEANPPQFGSVIISVVLNGIDYLPTSKKNVFYEYLRKRSLMRPVFVDPMFIYPQLTTTVHYDITKTAINPDDIKTLALDAIINYSNTKLNKFDSTLRFSRLATDIDDAHESIRSNETSIVLVRELNAIDWAQGSFAVDYGNKLTDISSDIFSLDQNSVVLEDDGDGIVNLKNITTGLIVRAVGTVNYDTGEVIVGTFTPDDTLTPIKLYATPRTKDVVSSLNTILKIRESDVHITVVKD
jgi:hypothetical protein